MGCIKKTKNGYRVDWRDKEGNRYRKTFALQKEATDHLADTNASPSVGLARVHTTGNTHVVPCPRESPARRDIFALHAFEGAAYGVRVEPQHLADDHKRER